uniref:Peptidase metallopeptidase domain-containing protein n=1 Tax=Conchiformibius kuhniae TaxID=211502 RepID=A0A8T9MS31_9NEIS|nr:hypothetical protein LVJ77_08930 [Conchiformibius kuhniae]
MKIGDKTYTSAINQTDRSFYIDVADADLPSLNGQTPQITVQHAQTVYHLVRKNSYGQDYKAEAAYAPKLDGSHVRWDKPSEWFDTSGNLGITPQTADSVTVRGTVSGSAKAGDTVLLTVGDSEIRTRVDEQLGFSAAVSRAELAKTGKVAALLQQDGQTVARGGTEVSREPESDGTFVSQHQHVAPEARPYFINALIPNNQIYLEMLAPFGQAQTPVLRYGFSQYRNDLPFSESNRQAVRHVWDIIERYANVKFEAVDADQTGMHYHLRDMSGGTKGYAEHGGSVYINKDLAGGSNGKGLTSGSSFGTVLHETMHALGGKHPANYMRWEKYPHTLGEEEDRLSTTVLSYTADQDSRPDLRLYDLAFLHYRFGVNPQARTGNDVYRFKPHNRGTADNDIYIWDGGGVDTFDASDQTQGVNVNLTPGSWIYAGEQSQLFAISGLGRAANREAYLRDFFGKTGAVGEISGRIDATDAYEYTQNQAFIGYGTQIERLIGSAHNDTLTGNNADNAIYGGAGNDTVKGGAGNDYLDGGAGADNLAGEAGNDTYVIDHTDDTVTETANNGTDTVHSYIDYTLGDHVENLHLFGDALNGTGNALSNHIVGNARDNVLAGKGGTDTLTGGAGKDVFVFSDLLSVDTVTDFTAGEDKIGLQRGVFTAIDRAETALQHIEYNQSNGQLSYQGQHFATIGTDLAIDGNSFVLIG